MKKLTFLFIVLAGTMGLSAQSLDTSIDWATVEDVTPAGKVITSGNNARNQITYWNRTANFVIGEKLFFLAATDGEANELWVLEGSSTKKVEGTDNLINPMHLIEANAILYFTASDVTADSIRYIYKYDGSNTAKVSDYPNPYGLSEFDGEILFGVENPAVAGEFFTCITDANATGGSRVISMDIAPAPNAALGNAQNWSQYAPFQVIEDRYGYGKKAIFFGKHKKYGMEICVTNGDTASVILDINRAVDSSSTVEGATLSTDRGDITIAVNKYQVAFRVVTPGFWGRDNSHADLQQNMWITDGYPQGTYLFEDQNRNEVQDANPPQTGNSFAGDPFLFKGALYFTGSTNNDRQIIVMKNTYPNHVSNGTSREEWIINGPDDNGVYGNCRNGYFGTYGEYMAFGARIDKIQTTTVPNTNKFNKIINDGLFIGSTYDNLFVADSSVEQTQLKGNSMINHITQYKDKLYYNDWNKDNLRNLRVYIKAEMAAGWDKDTSFWMGSFGSNPGANLNQAKGGPHNLNVVGEALTFIFEGKLYKLVDTKSDAVTPKYNYRDPEHYVPEGDKDWTSCIFDYGYGADDTTQICEEFKPLPDPISVADNKPVSQVGMVFPNPVTDQLSYRLENNEIAKSVTIFNTVGAVVYNNKSFEGKRFIDISHLAKGHYIITFETTDSKIFHAKFIKQ